MRALALGLLGPADRPAAALRPVQVDLNRAPVEVLQALPGIGPTRAEAIVLHRIRHGPFASVEALQAVFGIGADTVARLRPFVAVAAAPGR